MDDRVARWTSSTGIWVGSLAWAANTQLNYSLVPWVCSTGIRLTPWTAAGFALFALVGAGISGLAFRHRAPDVHTTSAVGGSPHGMLAVIGVSVGVLFAVVVIMQGLAGLFLTGCEK